MFATCDLRLPPPLGLILLLKLTDNNASRLCGMTNHRLGNGKRSTYTSKKTCNFSSHSVYSSFTT